jgi:hypothetical protein
MRVTPRSMPEAMARTPSVVVVAWLVVVRVCPGFPVDALFDVGPGRHAMMIVVVLDNAARFFAHDFSPFEIFALSIPRAIKVRSERRRGEQERQCSESNAFHDDEILGLTRRPVTL